VLSARNRLELERLRRRLRAGRAPDGVSLHRSLLTTELVAELHQQVELVMTWPVNDAEALAHVLEVGVSGVITDEPAVLRAVLALA
jgi:glycerophosphoryl diester phosphodiesterase